MPASSFLTNTSLKYCTTGLHSWSLFLMSDSSDLLVYQPIYAWWPIKGTLVNSVDIDQMLQHAASDQCLHCLHLIQEIL